MVDNTDGEVIARADVLCREAVHPYLHPFQDGIFPGRLVVPHVLVLAVYPVVDACRGTRDVLLRLRAHK